MKRDHFSAHPHGTPKRRAVIVPRIVMHCAKHPRDSFMFAKLSAMTDAKEAAELVKSAKAALVFGAS